MRTLFFLACALAASALVNSAAASGARAQDAPRGVTESAAVELTATAAIGGEVVFNDRRPNVSNPDTSTLNTNSSSVPTRLPEQLHQPPDPVVFLQSEVNSLEADVKALKARLADDEYKLAHHHHRLLGAHYVQITAHSIRDLLNAPDNPTITWPTSESWNVTEEPTFDPQN